MSFLENSIAYLKGVGPQKAALLKNELDISTYQDLLHCFPFRHVDKSMFYTIEKIQSDTEYVQIKGKIVRYQEQGAGHQKRLVALFQDDKNTLELLWFKGVQWVVKNLPLQQEIVVYGKVSFFMGKPQIAHPEIEPWVAFQANRFLFKPIYAGTEKLKMRGITSKVIAKMVEHLFDIMPPDTIVENIPSSILESQKMMLRQEAFSQIHFPRNLQSLESAKHRLKFEEFFIAQMRLANIRSGRYKHTKGIVFERLGFFFNTFYDTCLPFALTGAQKRVLKEIRKDTMSGAQMNRLLQGDVGSGKTVVALMVALMALDNNCQACIMAPTEILATQHYQNIIQLTQKLNLKIALLTSSVKGKARKILLEQLANNEIHLLIGTHSLVEKNVVFACLGLAVIDEQHKFGVAQRSALWQKNIVPPHILVMTATPIPRTLAMTAYGDLECSVIDELPPGRQAIKTVHRYDRERPLLIDFMKKEIASGRQIYVVFPLIEESEKMDYENLFHGIEIYQTYFREPHYYLSVVHGQQTPALKETNMQRFIQGHTQMMLSTTVIEVGVNVPNASMMIIESAEKFGLSQLHQLRGRVGRGSEKSYCVLLSGQKLSHEAKQRLATMCNTNDGFVIAEKDLEIRGPGEIDGTKQSGLLNFKLASITQDKGLLDLAKNKTEEIIHSDPELRNQEHAALKNYLLIDTLKNTSWKKIS